MRRILVIRFGALGDLVLATVLLPALRRAYPEAEIHWVTKRAWASLLAADPRLDRLIVLEAGAALHSLLPELAAFDYDLVVDAHANLRSRALCALLPPAPVRRLEKDSLARWILLRGGPVLGSLRRRLVDRYTLLATGEDADGLRPRVVFGTEAARAASEFLADRREWVAVAPGARHAAKRWPPEHFAAVAARLRASGCSILVVGGPDEIDALRGVAEAVEGAKVWPAERPLDQLAAALSRCALTVGNDSGLLHLSEAVGTAVVAIFGPTVREWGYYPLDPRSRVIEQDVACRPCSKLGDRPCWQPEPWCLLRSTPEQVGAAALDIWEQSRR